MFSDRFEELCKAKGVKPGRACLEMGVSRSLAAKWKATKTEKPSAEILEKMSAYFGVSIDGILGISQQKGPGTEPEPEMDVNSLEYALYGEAKDLDEDEKKQLLNLAKLMRKKRREAGR